MAKFRVEIDHDSCQGFGACVELCSKFELSDEDGKSHLKEEKDRMVTSKVEIIELDQLDCHKKAAEACPFKAIHIFDLSTQEKLI